MANDDHVDMRLLFTVIAAKISQVTGRKTIASSFCERWALGPGRTRKVHTPWWRYISVFDLSVCGECFGMRDL